MMRDARNIKFEYDPAKNLRNIEELGLSFDLADEILADPNMRLEIDDRRDYGEARYVAYGLVDGRRLRLCFTLRGDKVRVITLYKVHKKEWDVYFWHLTM